MMWNHDPRHPPRIMRPIQRHNMH